MRVTPVIHRRFRRRRNAPLYPLNEHPAVPDFNGRIGRYFVWTDQRAKTTAPNRWRFRLRYCLPKPTCHAIAKGPPTDRHKSSWWNRLAGLSEGYRRISGEESEQHSGSNRNPPWVASRIHDASGATKRVCRDLILWIIEYGTRRAGQSQKRRPVVLVPGLAGLRLQQRPLS